MSDTARREFERQCLKAHNRFRALHGCPAVELDEELTDEANAWAEELTTLRCLKHSPNPCLGENIYTVRATKLYGDVPVGVWYEEIKNYNFNQPREYFRAIHFTQLIWKECKKIGVGFAKRGMLFIVVVNYDPPGNVIGEFAENVPFRIPGLEGNDIGFISSDSTFRETSAHDRFSSTSESSTSHFSSNSSDSSRTNSSKTGSRNVSTKSGSTKSYPSRTPGQGKGGSFPWETSLLLLLLIAIGVAVGAFIYYNRK